MHDKKKRRRVFHVNLLKKWNPPLAIVCLAEELQDATDDVTLTRSEEEMLSWTWEDSQDIELVMGEHLSTAKRTELRKLLTTEYADVLQNKPGRTSLTQHTVHTDTAQPTRLPPYRLPHAYRNAVLQELKEMIASGVIEPTVSEWSSPLVVVPKKDGGVRLCVDYRQLNKVSTFDAYPMPRASDVIDRLGQKCFITTLDLNRGYWQVPMDPESRPKTAFSSPLGLFQFTVMPFGLCGAPATFQRLMDEVLRGAGDYADAYLDDIIIFSDTWSDHMDHLRDVLERLRRAGLTIKVKKCQFARSHCTYLGHVVGSGEVRPDSAKVEAVKNFPVPRTKRDVRIFLGLSGYYRRMIPDYSTIATPLTDLTTKAAPTYVVWTTKCNDAFQKLKQRLCNEPVLRTPDFHRQFYLQTDASDVGVGAVLSQLDDQGEDHPVAFFSRKLLAREQKYAAVEKECLAIKLAMQHFQVYLLGRLFVVQTDHRALQWLDQAKDTNSRLCRWSLAMQPYQFKVEHRAGTDNGNADSLSRPFV